MPTAARPPSLAPPWRNGHQTGPDILWYPSLAAARQMNYRDGAGSAQRPPYSGSSIFFQVRAELASRSVPRPLLSPTSDPAVSTRHGGGAKSPHSLGENAKPPLGSGIKYPSNNVDHICHADDGSFFNYPFFQSRENPSGSTRATRTRAKPELKLTRPITPEKPGPQPSCSPSIMAKRRRIPRTLTSLKCFPRLVLAPYR